MMRTEVLWGDKAIVDFKSGPHVEVPALVIDSGAACNVAGRKWITAWRKRGNLTSDLSLGKSNREFRLGGGVVHPSEGITELRGG